MQCCSKYIWHLLGSRVPCPAAATGAPQDRGRDQQQGEGAACGNAETATAGEAAKSRAASQIHRAAASAAREASLLAELSSLRRESDQKLQEAQQEVNLAQEKLTRTAAALAKERKSAEVFRQKFERMAEDLEGQTAECQRVRGDLAALERQHRQLMEEIQRERESLAEQQQQHQQQAPAEQTSQTRTQRSEAKGIAKRFVQGLASRDLDAQERQALIAHLQALRRDGANAIYELLSTQTPPLPPIDGRNIIRSTIPVAPSGVTESLKAARRLQESAATEILPLFLPRVGVTPACTSASPSAPLLAGLMAKGQPPVGRSLSLGAPARGPPGGASRKVCPFHGGPQGTLQGRAPPPPKPPLELRLRKACTFSEAVPVPAGIAPPLQAGDGAPGWTTVRSDGL
ncbi:uncharacterized protein LOC34621421 [Cyclospora cayetanensis]|uniref:Uncharacterized protein LOC34621421 n=1 Tax=Cyclospora cayetanensis TaxID=88456 RepID=A0A6P6RT71_9EIME|nr:uncharacterized protein LOC34621421 [Cyclospora cayetanensis]